MKMPVTDEERSKYLNYVTELATKLKCLDVDKDERVWHYTTGDTLISILESGTLFATQVACLNDSTEVLYGSKLLREAFLALPPETATSEEERKLLERFKVDDSSPSEPSNWFVTCFSKEKDDLSQWRAYGGGENGYAISFLAGAFFNRGSLVARVNYERDKHLEGAKEVAVKTLEFFKEGLDARSPEERDAWENEFLVEWDIWINKLAPMVKDPAFHSENEYRIIHQYTVSELSKLRFKQKHSLMSIHLPLVFPPPYIATQSSLLPILEVMVGPSRHKEQSRVSVLNLLRQKGYHNVPVTLSEIPFQST
jgi:hypothetical protein